MKRGVLLAILFSNIATGDPEHYRSYDGNYTLEFGYSSEMNVYKVDKHPSNMANVSIKNNSFEVNNFPYQYRCKIYQNLTTGSFFQEIIVKCKLMSDQQSLITWADENKTVFCSKRDLFDFQTCVQDRYIKDFEQTFYLNVVKDHLFLQQATSNGPQGDWFTGDLVSDEKNIEIKAGRHNQFLLKRTSNVLQKFNINQSKDLCNYLNSGCSYPEEWAQVIEVVDNGLIEKFSNVKRNLSISIPSSNYFVYGEDLYLNDGSIGEFLGGTLGTLAGSACEVFASLPGCTVAGAELGAYFGRELTEQDGSIIEQRVCVGYFHVYGKKESFNLDDYIYLCEKFSHPAQRDYSEYIPTYFTKPSVGFFKIEYEGID